MAPAHWCTVPPGRSDIEASAGDSVTPPTHEPAVAG